MGSSLNKSKSKISRRVLEIFEYFNGTQQHATVIDIARHYGRPQSSTFDLMTSLVELGFLYKEPCARSYSLTPRVAFLGTAAQPELIQSGLLGLPKSLAMSTGTGAALMGMVGLRVQMFGWAPGKARLGQHIAYGASELLTQSVAGQLLLSTEPPELCKGLLRRINAEAPEDAKFQCTAMTTTIRRLGARSHAVGTAGFIPGAQMCVALLPSAVHNHQLALGLIFDPAAHNADALLATLQKTVAGFGRKSLYAVEGQLDVAA